MGLNSGLISTTNTVPNRGVLSVVVVKLNMVDGVVTGRVDQPSLSKIDLVVDHHRPAVDNDEHAQEDHIVHGNEINSNVVRNTLTEAVDGVEGVAAKWCGVTIGVVGLVNKFVD